MCQDTRAEPPLPLSPIALTFCPSCCGAAAAPHPGLGAQAAFASCSHMSSSGLDRDAVNEGGDLLVLVHPARAQEHGSVSAAPEVQQQPQPAKRASLVAPQPRHCPAHMLALPHVPPPKGPQPRESVAYHPRRGQHRGASPGGRETDAQGHPTFCLW